MLGGDIEHLGSAHTAEGGLPKAAGRQKQAAGQGELDLGLQTGVPGGCCRSPRRGWAACWMRCRCRRRGRCRASCSRLGAGAADAGYRAAPACRVRARSAARLCRWPGPTLMPYRAGSRRTACVLRNARRPPFSGGLSPLVSPAADPEAAGQPLVQPSWSGLISLTATGRRTRAVPHAGRRSPGLSLKGLHASPEGVGVEKACSVGDL